MKNLVPALLIVLSAACGSKGIEDDLDNQPPDRGPPVAYGFLANFPDIMEFMQGKPRSFDLASTAQVPKGEPVLTPDKLPDGAVFDGKIFSWTPPCDLPKEYFQNGLYGVHYMSFTLKSSLDEEQFVENDVLVVVHRHPEDSAQKCGQQIQ